MIEVNLTDFHILFRKLYLGAFYGHSQQLDFKGHETLYYSDTHWKPWGYDLSSYRNFKVC